MAPTLALALLNLIVLMQFSVQPSAITLTAGALPGASETNCSYSIEIETTCATSAGTTDVVGARFGHYDGNIVVVRRLRNPQVMYDAEGGAGRQGSRYKGFGKCVVEAFDASGPCVNTKVCSLYLKSMGSDDWRPGWAKVFRRQSDGNTTIASFTFYFRTFLPANVWYGFDYCNHHRPFITMPAPLGF